MNDSSKDIKWLITGLLIGLVLAPLLFIAGMYFYKNQKESSTSSEPIVERSDLPVTETVSNVTVYPENKTNEMYQWLFEEEAMQVIPRQFKKAIVATFQHDAHFKDNLYDFLDSPGAKILAYGDFDNDYKQDLACLFEKKDSGSAVLTIFAYKQKNEQPSLCYYKHLTDIPSIQTSKKGEKVFLNSQYLHPAPLDGIMIDYGYQKDLLLFHAKSGNFRVYDQHPTDLFAPKKAGTQGTSLPEEEWIEHEEELIEDEN